jgi:hypothetical protein
MGFFSWITEGVRRAVALGIEKAAADINQSGDAEVIIRLPTHREPLRLPHEEPATNGRGKKVATTGSRV